MPSLITHPAHPMHTLTLLPKPAYPSGSFRCDGCGGYQSHGFNYHCNYCDFDVHITCATKPLSLAHQSHPHQLSLVFQSPYHSKGFSCDICRRIGSNHWLYRCGPCGFDVHLECATATTGSVPVTSGQYQPQLQHHYSLPGPNQYHQPGGMNHVILQHSQSLPVQQPTIFQQPSATAAAARNIIYQQQPTAGPVPGSYYQQQPTAGPVQGSYYQQQPIGAARTSYQQQQPGVGPMQANYQPQTGVPIQAGYNYNPQQMQGNGAGNNTLVDTLVQGFVDGAGQQAGQMFVQGIMGGDANNSDGSGNDANGNGDSSSSDVISIGSSILSGMFGDSNSDN
ncbi:hypothetical protein Tsubulata_040248 [Turnera subulata]|uniref:DC1 domain-containing protein n=1 Tax=Turnera subulata TaxID=218843 RepID=A0A9Q0FXJ8_9ROSI|nr:hypothetical protein Tsubulata_040248 [Turnera subulata]